VSERARERESESESERESEREIMAERHTYIFRTFLLNLYDHP
jgi:hypothetical protein